MGAHHGQVSYKNNPDGSESPYELNITYVDAIIAGEKEFPAQKFLASQAIQYVLPGVPATYIHSMLGSRNWMDGVSQTGRVRSINREKLNVDDLVTQLNNSSSLRCKIFSGYCLLMKIRRRQSAFHPKAGFEILDVGSKVFAVKRHCCEQEIVALTNISRQKQTVELSGTSAGVSGIDLLTGKTVVGDLVELEPYQYLWLV